MNQKMIIGNAEAICLPELGITHLEARIDTGAQSRQAAIILLEHYAPTIGFIMVFPAPNAVCQLERQ